MSSDNAIGIWFDGEVYRVAEISASDDWTDPKQVVQMFARSECRSSKENAMELARSMQIDWETEYGICEVVPRVKCPTCGEMVDGDALQRDGKS